MILNKFQAVAILLKSMGSHHRQKQIFGCTRLRLKDIELSPDLSRITLGESKWRIVKLHLTKIDDVVCSVDHKVDLGTIVATFFDPAIILGSNLGDTQLGLDLPHVLHADRFKAKASP